MTIQGIQNGAVLQRDPAYNRCDIRLSCNCTGRLKCSMGTLFQISENEWEFSGIETGGPYTVSFTDDETNITFQDLYVGDVWLLSGQSNMEGAGRMRNADYLYEQNPIRAVRALYMDDTWREARPQLHQLWLSSDTAHIIAFQNDLENKKRLGLRYLDNFPAPQIRGVGPGFYFAKKLYESTAVPQGVIPCAVGGAPISMWTPPDDGVDNYYSAALRRLVLSGKNIRGLFWYQGEGYSGDLADYKKRFSAMRDGFATFCGKEVLPAVQVQIFRCFLPGYRNTGAMWSQFRQFQWDMAHTLPSLAVVPTNDLELDDLLHLSADAQERLGKRAADAMLYIAMEMGSPEPELEFLTATKDTCVEEWTELCVHYRNLRGNLCSRGIPCGFMLSKNKEDPNFEWIQHVGLQENTVHIRCELSLKELRQRYLWYGFGHDIYCNITDEEDHAIPAMGPISLQSI